VPGMIELDQESRRCVLHLDGSLRASESFPGDDVPVIHGALISGPPVSLFDCIATGHPLSGVLGVSSQRSYLCRLLIRGACLLESDVYSHISFDLTDLRHWLGYRGFSVCTDFPNSDEARKPTFRMATEQALRRVVETSRGRVTLDATPHLEITTWSAGLGAASRFEIVPTRPLSFSQLQVEVVRPLQHFLTVATGRPQDVIELRLVPARHMGGSEPRDDHDWVEAVSERFANHAADAKPPFRDEMLFSLPDVDRSLARCLDAWFELNDTVGPVLWLATAATYRSGMFLDQRFLYAAQALEVYHRRRIGGTEKPEDEFKKVKQLLLDSAPEKHRKWLKTKLEYANELSLLSRLEWFRENVCTRVAALLGRIESWEKWVRDTRNNFTHHSEGRRRKLRRASGVELLALTETAYLVLDDMIIRELGLSDLARNQAVAGTRRFRNAEELIGRCSWATPSRAAR
jgi:hypothetical protein